MTFTVSLSAASGRPVTVPFRTNAAGWGAGFAWAGIDYDARKGKLTFAPGETAKTVAVTLRGDARTEPDETFFFDLAAPTNAVLATSRAVGTIRNDD
jgi:hypothetical protein